MPPPEDQYTGRMISIKRKCAVQAFIWKYRRWSSFCWDFVQVRQRFVDAGGKLFEMAAVNELTVHPDGVEMGLAGPPAGKAPPPPQPLPPRITCRLVLDCMGNASPIVRQVCLCMVSERLIPSPSGACEMV